MTKLIVIICVLALAAVTMAEDQFVVLKKCDCPDGYTKEYWTTQKWSGYNFIEKKAYTKVDTAKFPYFRCMKWVDLLGTGEKDHGIEADPDCSDDTIWDDGDKITPISPVILNGTRSWQTMSGNRVNLGPSAPLSKPRVWRSADPEGFCWISGDYVGWATSDSLNQYMHVECRPAHYRVELMKLPDPDTGLPRRPSKVVVK